MSIHSDYLLHMNLLLYFLELDLHILWYDLVLLDLNYL